MDFHHVDNAYTGRTTNHAKPFGPELQAWKDYLYWKETDRKQFKKINDLIKEIDRTPFNGVGKPEPLKQNLKGFWSRRIDHEHRIIYKVEDDQVVYIAFRFHYSK